MAAQDFDLPESVITVLPNDPFEQLDLARKITSIALATRVSALESEISYLEEIVTQKDDMIAELKAQIESFAQKDDVIAELRTQVGNLQASATSLSNSVAQANEEKERLVDENASLSNMVKKLNRDVTKLEVFKKALMQSLNEEEGGSKAGAPNAFQRQLSDSNFSTTSNNREEETSSLASEDASGNTDTDVSKQGYNIHIPSLSTTPRLASRNITPKLTPPGSPPRSATSPPKLPGSGSDPRRHSIAIASRRSLFEADRSSTFSSTPSMTSPFDSASNAGRTRVDGKEFFRQVRNRLSIEQFSSFLANVKELNSHKQTREETLRKAEEIFGPDKKDLYTIFEGLITRNVH